MIRARISLPGGLALVAVAMGSLGVLASGPQQIPTVAGYNLPAALADGQFILAPATGAPTISAERAQELALLYAGALAEKPKGVSVQHVLFTDSKRSDLGADGAMAQPFVNVSAWVVRFTGVPQPIFGPYGSTTDGAAVAQELNVVIDAESGEYIEMFSYQ
jgi:hypothetical protein